eukprot:762084-Hanusia_phi.AAC.1
MPPVSLENLTRALPSFNGPLSLATQTEAGPDHALSDEQIRSQLMIGRKLGLTRSANLTLESGMKRPPRPYELRNGGQRGNEQIRHLSQHNA